MHINAICVNITPYHQFLNIKFGNLMGGGKFAASVSLSTQSICKYIDNDDGISGE